MGERLPPEFLELEPDRSVSTEDLLQLNAVAKEHRHLAMNEDGERALSAGGRHHGTLILITDDAVKPAESHGGMRTRQDAWLIVAWILDLDRGQRVPQLMGCRAASWFGLDAGIVDEVDRIELHRSSLAFLRRSAARGLEIPNRAGERTRLQVPDDPF